MANAAGSLYGVDNSYGLWRWNGANWQGVPQSTVLAGSSRSYVLPNDHFLVLGGFITQFWNGSTTYGLTAIQNPTCAAVLASGSVVVANSIGGLQLWNGSQWSTPFPSLGGYITSLVALPNGEFLVAGSFATATGLARIARWTASGWVALGTGFNDTVIKIDVLPTGAVIAVGTFTAAGGLAAQGIAIWNGTAWSAINPPTALLPMPPLGFGGTEYPTAVLPNGDYLVAGIDRYLRWNGATWSDLGIGLNGTIRAMAEADNGDLFLGGEFTSSGLNRVARQVGSGWQPLGAGMDGEVNALHVLGNGTLVAGGEFTTSGGVVSNHIAAWDGIAWSAFGSGANDTVTSMAQLPNGDLVVAGAFTSIDSVPASRVARWNGTTWSPLGAGLDDNVTWLASLPNGDIVANGSFTATGSNPLGSFARWDGMQWIDMGTPWSGNPNWQVRAITTTVAGGVVVAGRGSISGPGFAYGMQAWSGGTTWSGMLSLPLYYDITRLLEVPGAGVLAAIASTAGLYRTDGTYGSFMSLMANTGSVDAVLLRRSGAIIAAGALSFANGMRGVQEIVSTCPATTAIVGVGCTGSVGVSSLGSNELPWAGSTFHASGSNLPSSAFILGLTGFSTLNVPLATLLPPSPTGCNLMVSPDAVDLLTAVGGSVVTSLTIPNSTALAQLVVHQQLVALEYNGSLQWIDNTTSNALRLVVGSY